MRFKTLLALILAIALYAASGRAADAAPEKYTLDYPEVTRVVPPVRSTFYEVTRTTERVNGKTFRHPLNGGFGIRLKHPSGKRMVHLGADLGWFRVGAPVSAVAEGVVRISNPSLRAQARQAGIPIPKLPRGSMLWGNIIVIEHRLKNGAFVTTLYGHLGDDRRVKVGDIVKPGQQIGTVGKESKDVNGGYKPHLHFGVRYGRTIEKGRTLFTVPLGAKLFPANVVDFSADRVQIDFGELKNRALEIRKTLGGTVWNVTEKDGKHYMPAQMLWLVRTPAFPLIGYADSTKGWIDPIAFLRKPDRVKPGAQSGRDLKKPIVLKVYDVLGKPAPSWGVEQWANLPDGKKTLDPADYKGKTVAIFCFQSACPRCKSYGFKTWKKVMAHYTNDADVKFVAIQTANEKFRNNRFTQARAVGRRYRWTIPIGHQGSSKNRPALMQNYGVNSTPWMIVIDSKGLVRMNVILPNAESCINLIDRTKKLGQFPPKTTP